MEKKGSIRKLSFLGFKRSMSDNGQQNEGSSEVRLDEEMEKVFAMSGNLYNNERFDVSVLTATQEKTTGAGQPAGRLAEDQLTAHRKRSYPHMHAPLKVSHSSSRMKRRVTSPQLSETEATCSEPLANTATSNPGGSRSGVVSDSITLPSSITSSGIPTISSATTINPSFSSPPVDSTITDDTVAAGCLPSVFLTEDDLFSSGSATEIRSEMVESPLDSPTADKRVQFICGGIEDIPEQSDDERLDSDAPTDIKKHRRKARHHHGYHHRFRKFSLQEQDSHHVDRRVSIQPEDETLEEADIDELTSHRSDYLRNSRRHKPLPKTVDTVHIGRKDDFGPEGDIKNALPLQQRLKKMYDHSPHSVFVQLDELFGEGDEREWKETARWIKYEEDREEGSDRWGRPHVASLSFHSLLNLRRCLETGVVLLDLEEKDLPGVSYRLVEQMVVDELIQDSDKPAVMRALLLRHRHVHEHERGFRFGKKNYSSYTSLQNLSEKEIRKASAYSDDVKRKTSMLNMEAFLKNGVGDQGSHLIVPDGTHTIVDMKEETYGSSIEDLKKAHNESILKKIPIGAEATVVLVGAVDFLEQPTIAFVRLAEGIQMSTITEVPIPTRFLFILIGPHTADLDYHEIGRSISTLMANSSFHNIAYKADDRKALLSAINEFLDDSIVLPPGDWEQKALLPFNELKAKSVAIRKRKQNALKKQDEAMKSLLSTTDSPDEKKPPPFDPLRRTKRPFGGLINDLRRRFPYYKSDIVEGLNGQCIAAAIFMYFAALSGAITFGGLMSDKTENMIGISETLVATAIAGVFMALFAGQPLVIVGSTGPLLLFDESLYKFCISNGIEFVTLRLYIGLWIAIIAILVASVEGSVLVKLFTRFTEEIFSALISLIYIVESLMKLVFVFGAHPLLADYCNTTSSDDYTEAILQSNSPLAALDALNTLNDSVAVISTAALRSDEDVSVIKVASNTNGPINQPNTALFCTILALGTFTIAYYLRLFRNSKFLGRSARRALGDFGVPIAIIIMVSLDYIVPGTYTEKLKVPEGLSPSNPDARGWLIDPSGYGHPPEMWLVFTAGIPAILVYILAFMETHISELIIDKKERKLKKGSGFHLDIVLVSLLNAGCGIIGAPWLSVATVRSVAHVSALTVMSQTHAPGEKPHIVEVKEQRLSALIVAVLIGVSVLMSPLLRLVPMSVLFGIFLYMGVSSTNGIQFFDRFRLFFMPVKHHPSVTYVKRVHPFKMHLFTFIQLVCLAVLWFVKSSQISLAFPFFLILMLPLRAQLRCIFTDRELRALDGDEPEDKDDDDDEPDFYAEAPLPG